MGRIDSDKMWSSIYRNKNTDHHIQSAIEDALREQGLSVSDLLGEELHPCQVEAGYWYRCITRTENPYFELGMLYYCSLDNTLEVNGQNVNPSSMASFSLADHQENYFRPKFKAGQWITDGIRTYRIESVNLFFNKYYFSGWSEKDCLPISYVEKNAHLWTVADARQYDILACKGGVFIFKDILGGFVRTHCGYCSIKDMEEFSTGCDRYAAYSAETDETKDFHPASKTDVDLLCSKMEEAGFEWDNAKKELRPIEIVWDGHNLDKVVSLVGLNPNFKTFSDYVHYVHDHGDIFVIIIGNTHYEIQPGCKIKKDMEKGVWYPVTPGKFELVIDEGEGKKENCPKKEPVKDYCKAVDDCKDIIFRKFSGFNVLDGTVGNLRDDILRECNALKADITKKGE